MRRLPLLLVAIASAAAAQGARVAVHPLELSELTEAQREKLQAQFDVMLARVADIHLAGSAMIEDALQKRAGQGCEQRDECLRFLAQATESVYAIHARVRPDPLGNQLVLSARVVRSDGAMVRRVTLMEPLTAGAEPLEKRRVLLGQLLDDLDLNRLSPTVVAERAVTRPASREPIGIGLLGLGTGALLGGAVLAGLAASGKSTDREGDVARETAGAAVMIPVGALIALAGGALVWWPFE